MKAKEPLIEMLIDKQVLKFGSFKLNSGRISPYFFNLGAIDDGMSFYDLGLAYARKIHDEEFVCDVLFGPCLLYTSPSPRDRTRSRMPSSA